MLYIACSLDGYIAKANDDLSFLNRVQKENEDYGYSKFIATVDAVIVGRKTYEWVLNQGYTFPHTDKECYIITRSPRAAEGSVSFYTGDLKELVQGLKEQPGGNIFCDGGAEIVHELLKEKLIDEMIISIVPTLVGSGTRLFKEGRPEQEFELVAADKFDTGLIQLYYKTAQN